MRKKEEHKQDFSVKENVPDFKENNHPKKTDTSVYFRSFLKKINIRPLTELYFSKKVFWISILIVGAIFLILGFLLPAITR